MTKLMMKCGDIEIECDGTEDFLKEELPKLMRGMAEFRSTRTDETDQTSHKKKPMNANVGTDMSVSTLAQKLTVSSGTELIMAAALSLSRAGADSFTKKQLRERTKEAKAFYKSSYASNFDNYVSRLVGKGRLNHMTGETYALPAAEATAIGQRLIAAG